MITKFLKRINPLSRSNWTNEQWRTHLLNNSYSSSERAEINAIFARDNGETFHVSGRPKLF